MSAEGSLSRANLTQREGLVVIATLIGGGPSVTEAMGSNPALRQTDCIGWLAPPTAPFRERSNAKSRTKVFVWPQDEFRHSYGTATGRAANLHLGNCEDAGATAVDGSRRPNVCARPERVERLEIVPLPGKQRSSSQPEIGRP